MYSTIVVGIDGSPTARAAMEEAAELARLTGARVHLVTAYQKGQLAALMVDPLTAATLIESAGRVDQELAASMEQTVEAAAADLRKRGIEVETYAIDADPADAIISVAETAKADLIMVGNKGMRGAKRFILGSVPNSVAHHAPCNVMIVSTT